MCFRLLFRKERDTVIQCIGSLCQINRVKLRWLPVTSFLKYTLGVLAFKCVKGLAPSYLCHRFKTRDCVHDRNTRYKNNLNIPAYKSASGQRTFLYRATSFWNSLPCEIRGCDNLPIFKRHLKEFLSSF